MLLPSLVKGKSREVIIVLRLQVKPAERLQRTQDKGLPPSKIHLLVTKGERRPQNEIQRMVLFEQQRRKRRYTSRYISRLQRQASGSDCIATRFCGIFGRSTFGHTATATGIGSTLDLSTAFAGSTMDPPGRNDIDRGVSMVTTDKEGSVLAAWAWRQDVLP